MTQSAYTRGGKAVDASAFSTEEWDAIKAGAILGDFVMPCCKAPAVPKTSIKGLPFFAHLSDECATAPETMWHKSGKAAVLAALAGRGIAAREEVPGQAPSGERWEADVLFSVGGRVVAIQLQRSYQHLRDFLRRQARYEASGVECYWLARYEVFLALAKKSRELRLQRDFGGKFSQSCGLGVGMLPELPVAVLADGPDAALQVNFGLLKSATVSAWLDGVLDGTYQFRAGCWNLD